MSKSSAAHWVKFFNASGIPSPAAASYAHIFVENRMQSDMMMDLNKDYLREMGITRMGDIIAILRHAKTVSDQNAREKVLGVQNAIPVATITASAIKPSSSSTKISLKQDSSSSRPNLSSLSQTTIGLTHPLPKAPRRVLPEHEGKYKIKLPTGTTERSKQILAKREKLYSDRVSSSRKTDVFSRLAKHKQTTITESARDDDSEGVVSSSGSNESGKVRVQVTGVSSATVVKRSISGIGSSSVFARLGGKADTEMARQIKPILKKPQKSHSAGTGVSSTGGITKAKNIATPLVRSQKVMLVTKVPVKRGDSDEESYSDNGDDYDSAMDCDGPATEKFVKFASTAEVREIEPVSNYKREKGSGITGGIKSRLGIVSKLHSTKKTYNLKASSANTRISPVKGKTIRLKSDELLSRHELPVHHRLGNCDSSKPLRKSSVVQRNSSDHRNNYKVKRSSSASSTYGAGPKRQQSSASVFDRLGFNSSI